MSLLGMVSELSREGIRFVVIGGLAARPHGSTRITEDLDICYDTEAANVQRLARVLSDWNAYLRGVEPEWPFTMDERALRNAPVMTLTTDRGAIDVFDIVAGVGGCAQALASSVEVAAGGVTFRALDLPGVIKAKRATGRPRDADRIPELEALLQLGRGRS